MWLKIDKKTTSKEIERFVTNGTPFSISVTRKRNNISPLDDCTEVDIELQYIMTKTTAYESLLFICSLTVGLLNRHIKMIH